MVEKPVAASVVYNNDCRNKFIKPFEMDYNIVQRSLQDPEIISSAVDKLAQVLSFR